MRCSSTTRNEDDPGFQIRIPHFWPTHGAFKPMTSPRTSIPLTVPRGRWRTQLELQSCSAPCNMNSFEDSAASKLVGTIKLTIKAHSSSLWWASGAQVKRADRIQTHGHVKGTDQQPAHLELNCLPIASTHVKRHMAGPKIPTPVMRTFGVRRPVLEPNLQTISCEIAKKT